jgi:phosphoribosylglycinamide formyltransferase 2
MTQIGTALSPSATKVLLLGSGELGKEVAIELQRLGCEVIACDRYANAPAMQVAHRSHVFSMLDAEALLAVVDEEKPDLIVPEIEAIATDALVKLEAGGQKVVPTARAAQLTMNREGIRRLAAETLSLPCSPYRFVGTAEDAKSAVQALGCPCVIKPLMSSSGHGQSVIQSLEDVDSSWQSAQDGARGAADGRCIIEGFINFDYEITMLTVSAVDGIQCCEPVGHVQKSGDYRESWQPCAMSAVVRQKAEELAKTIVSDLGGHGLFGVEMFICGEEVIFSEVSPRPHDTGLVTLGTQNLSEFALHARAILSLPIGQIRLLRAGASVPLLGHGDGIPTFKGLDSALQVPDTQLRLFGKPRCAGERRLAVAIATGDSVDEARERAARCVAAVEIVLE